MMISKPEHSSHNRVMSIFVLSLVLIGLLLRIFTFFSALKHYKYNPYSQMRGDMAADVALAISLSEGKGYSLHYYNKVLDKSFFKDPKHCEPKEPARPTAIKPIGYPLFLALIFKIFSYRLAPILFAQGILSTSTLILIYAIGLRVGSRKVALIALCMAVFYYPFWYKGIIIMGDTLLIFSTILFIYMLIRWFMKPSIVSGFCAGLAGGVAFLVKPVVLPIIPIYLAWGYFSHRRLKTRTFISSAAALVCALALLVAPWVVRNYKYSGRLLLTPTMGGYQFLLLYNDSNLDFMSYSLPGFVNELYPGFPDSVLPGLKVNIRDPSVPPLCAEYLQDQAYARSATHFVKTHPRHFFRALPRSFWNMWRITYPSAIPLRKMSDFVFYGAMIPFFFLGVYNVLKKRNIQALLIVAFFIYFIAFHIALASMIRYRITVMPLFFVLAAYGLAEIWEKVARKYGYARNLNNHPHI